MSATRSAGTLAAILLTLAGCATSGPTQPEASVEVAALGLALQHSAMVVGTPNRVIATAQDASGKVLEPGSYPIVWNTSDSMVANITAGGAVVAGRVGTVEFTARSGPVEAVLQVSVGPGAPFATSIVLSSALGKVGDRASVTGYVVDAFGNPIRQIGVYCSCNQDPSVARWAGSIGEELEIVAPGQFLLSINHVDYGVPGTERLFDIRE